jgi:flavin-dependent dehydrogenase
MLLSAAKETGASAMEGALLDAVKESPGGDWEIFFRCRGGRFAARPRIVIDATGRRCILSGKRNRYGAPTVALFAYARSWNAAGIETRVEAGPEEWFWGAPLPDGRFIAAVFVDSRRIRELLKRTDLRTAYHDLLRHSQLLSRSLNFDSHSPVMACDATCYYHEEPISRNLVRVGESAFSVDPLSSQGVEVAMGSALHAAAVANTILQRPDDRHLAEDFYRKRQEESVAFHRTAAAELYAQAAKTYPEEFWQARAAGVAGFGHGQARKRRLPMPDQAKVRLSAQAKLVTEPLLKGDTIISGRAVVHPNLRRPLAFLDGISVAPLLEPLRNPLEAHEVRRMWLHSAPEDQAKRLLQWFWDEGIIVPPQE